MRIAGRARRRHVQRRQAQQLLVGQVQQFLAGDQQVHLRRRGQRLHQRGGRVEHMFDVVQHQQRPPRRDCRSQHGGQVRRAIGRQRDAQHLGHAARQQRRVAQWRGIDPPDAVGPVPALRLGAGQRQAGLADAAGADHAHQAMRLHQRGQRAQRVVAADQPLRRRRQSAWRRRGGHRRREVVDLQRDLGIEAVAATRHRGDRIRTQHLAQCADVHVQVGLLDQHAPPHGGQQFLFADDATALFDEHVQQVQRARLQRRGLAVAQQPALRRTPLEGPEAVDGRACHGTMLPQRFRTI
ncbi:MAG TPA: hypothetical protein PKO45_14655 [Rubrivivax sp.]|nr:hypothetical protein [Rubrivivax sp.]